MAREYSIPDRLHPCLTPLCTSKGPLKPPLIFKILTRADTKNLQRVPTEFMFNPVKSLFLIYENPELT